MSDQLIWEMMGRGPAKRGVLAEEDRLWGNLGQERKGMYRRCSKIDRRS